MNEKITQETHTTHYEDIKGKKSKSINKGGTNDFLPFHQNPTKDNLALVNEIGRVVAPNVLEASYNVSSYSFLLITLASSLEKPFPRYIYLFFVKAGHGGLT